MPVVIIEGDVRIPKWVEDIPTFRRWCDSDDFPEEGRIDYLQGEVWVDMSREQVFSHNQVKTEFTVVLGGLVKTGKLGRYFTDGLRVSNIDADISVQPDGTFISNETMREGNIKLIEGAREGFVEVEGVPDMVLEIISDSSVKMDTKRLPKLYWEAGIKEYWLVDVRGQRLSFDIFRSTSRGYVTTKKPGGWLRSAVFDRSFRLTRGEDAFDNPQDTLDVK